MKPLEGVTVIDFTHAYSGPFCTMNLADFGANVIKIEKNHDIGDQSRYWGPFNQNGYSGYFASYNRNKTGVALDITKPEGKEIVKKLVKNADIVVENFKVGTLDKLGLGYEELRKINPEIILASLSGFGENGPLKDLAAYDNIIEAMSGIMEMTGFPDGPCTRAGSSIGDCYLGLYGAFAILMAYYHKLVTGKGQKINIAMLDILFALIEAPFFNNLVTGKEVTRCGNSVKHLLAPYDVYKCKDGYFAAGITSDSTWPDFCKCIEKPELEADPRFTTMELRCSNYDALTEVVSPFFLSKTKAELMDHLSQTKLACGPVMTTLELLDYPQLKAREMLIEADDPGLGKYIAVGNPVKLSKTPASIKKGAPLLGQDTQSVLVDLGYDQKEIDYLVAEGIADVNNCPN